MMTISTQIKTLRQAKKLTQKELGQLLNVSDKTISSWEQGRTYPDISMLLTLSDVFGLSVDELLKGDKQMVATLDQDLKLKKRYKGILVLGLFLLASLGLFFKVYQYQQEWVDRLNPFLEMTVGYATLPSEVRYDANNLPLPYQDIDVLDSPFDEYSTLTFYGGQSPEGRPYAMVQHKGLYVERISFVSWDSIPGDFRDRMTKEYVE